MAIIGSFQMEDFSVNEYEQLTDRPTSSDSVLKQMFPAISLSSFAASLTERYLKILKRAVSKLLLFTSLVFMNLDFCDAV
jgi:hypothetical protein